jgi:hypothetical protein
MRRTRPLRRSSRRMFRAKIEDWVVQNPRLIPSRTAESISQNSEITAIGRSCHVCSFVSSPHRSIGSRPDMLRKQSAQGGCLSFRIGAPSMPFPVHAPDTVGNRRRRCTANNLLDGGSPVRSNGRHGPYFCHRNPSHRLAARKYACHQAHTPIVRGSISLRSEHPAKRTQLRDQSQAEGRRMCGK